MRVIGSRMCRTGGFTIVEMAIVLAMIALILGTGLTVFSVQQDQRRIEDTKGRLSDAREALIGFAIVKGRLPCPADPTIPTGTVNAGIERVPIASGCTGGANAIQGDFPWATLGLPETDAWGHRFTYRVAAAFAAQSTPLFSLATNGNIDIGSAANTNDLASNMPAVIVSHGINGLRAYLPSGRQMPVSADADETDNADIDGNFVSKALTPTFDDQVIWLSQYTLFNRMVQAGKLP
jgi:type II secretory pathway pseudopilin PulG